MDVCKATKVLCRSYASLSLSASALKLPILAPGSVGRCIQSSSRCQSCRKLSTSAVWRQQAAARKPRAESGQRTSGSDVHDIYKSRRTFLDELNPNSKTSPNRSVLSNSFRPQQPRATTLNPQRTTSLEGSSVDDILAESENRSRPVNGSLQSAGGEKYSSWGAPQQQSPISTPAWLSRYHSDTMNYPGSTTVAPAPPKPRVIMELDIHVKPRTGRSVAVDPQKPNDLGSKLRALEMLCNRNKIRGDFNKQRFHERPGLKRKRLASQRWRANFKSRFQGVVARVNDLKAQGW